jgi:hypothetical protein
MELKSFEAIMGALADHEVRCLLVGGMAVVAHGHGRMTHDLDLGVQEPFDFDQAYARAHTADLEGLTIRFVDLATLIAMKEAAGRPIDLDDVRHLRLLSDEEARP